MNDHSRIIFFRKVRLFTDLLIILLPAVLLMGLGLSAIIYSETALMIFIGSSIVVSIAVLLSRAVRKRENEIEMTEYLNTEGLGEASDNWSKSEVELWEYQKEKIAELLQKDNNWNAIYRVHAHVVASEIASFYNKNSPYEVNAIELLIATEELSKRYRKILRDKVPFIEHAKISTILSTINTYQNYSPYIAVASDTYGAIKTVVKPFFNLPGVVSDYIQGQLSNKVKSEFTGKIEFQLKLTLLEEIVAVSIDLYSGRFSVSNDELGTSSGLQKDEKLKNVPLEPIRVAVIGQVSSGKSTLTNILCNETLAETDILPSTDELVVYSAVIDGDEQIRIIDLPGLDGSDKANKQTLREVLESDIVLWALRANQTARNNDVVLREQISAYYAENPQRKAPRIVGVVTQVDKLSSASDFSTVEQMSDLIDESAIEQLIKYNIDKLTLDDTVLISTVDNKTIGIDSLHTVFVKHLWASQQSQLNRRRLEASSISLSKQFDRAFRSSKAIISATKCTK